MLQDTIDRLAVGQPTGLGFLYNAYSDKPCNVSILTENPPPPHCIITTDIPNTESDYVHVKSASDKFNSLNVAAELKVSLFCGLISVKGSGKYFRDEKTSARSATVSFIHKITTKHETLSLLDDKLRPNINVNALRHRGATHVVTGITWGANVIVTVESKNEEKRDVKEIAGSLEAELKKSAVQIEGSGNVDLKGGENYENDKFQLKIVGDVLVNDKLPQTIEGAMALVAGLPTMIQQYNNGKGVPVRYELTSLEAIESYFAFNVKVNSILHTLKEQTIIRIISVFDEIAAAKQTLNDFCEDVGKYSNYLPEEDATKILDLKHNAALAESEFRGQLQTLLVQVRSSLADASELEDLNKEYQSGPYSPSNIQRALNNDFRKTLLTIEHLQRFIALGIRPVPKQVQSLTNKLLECKDKQVYVLFGESEAMSKNGKLWADHVSVLRALAGVPDLAQSSEFLYVDLDVCPHLKPLELGDDRTIVLQRFNKRGKCVDEDYYKTFLEETAVDCALSEKMIPNPPRHNNVAILELPCPKFWYQDGKSCGSKLRVWKCHTCKNVIDWGFDGFFYCSCGKGPQESYKFRCSHPEHEDEFYSFPTKDLAEQLKKLRRMKELNILILGETGVGKSTWINGILNYMAYSSLDEAVDPSSELLYAIPMSFNIDNGSGKMVQVKVGEDKNEYHKTGSAATQSSRPYTLRSGNQLIRLIDTPGICDTRGIDQDKKNLENILCCLQKYEEIHGICILLLPNLARMSASFTFCVKELLAHLHKGASSNIVFVYTNSRGHMYHPAETSACLRTLLSQIDKGIVISHKTQYCMDNEAIRFLAAYKNEKVNFPSKYVELFAGSWTHSTEETVRLLKHIETVSPHATTATLSLNQVRRIVNDLGRPLGEIAKNIADNIRLAEEHKERLKTIDLRNLELEKDLRIPVTKIETKNLKYPRTVCAAANCVTYVKGEHGNSHCVYSQVCHDECKLTGLPVSLINEPLIQRCVAMCGSGDSTTCQRCGCSWKVHMHLTYDLELHDGFEEVKEIKDMLKEGMDGKRMQQATLVKIDDRIKQLEKERDIITKISARFAVFLKRNAICLFNDATIEYLDFLIENERTNDKAATEQRLKTMSALQKMKAAYEEQKTVLEGKLTLAEQMEGIEEISVDNIQLEIQNLYDLPINGSSIKEMVDEGKRALTAFNHFSEIQLDAIARGKTKGGSEKKSLLSRFKTYWWGGRKRGKDLSVTSPNCG